MTEAEWLTSQRPGDLLSALGARLTGRKHRLLAVACCRAVWGLLPDARSRHAVEVAERFADGLASNVERRAASAAAHQAKGINRDPTWAAAWVVNANEYLGAEMARLFCGVSWPDQANLVREIFGPVLFRPIAVAPEGGRWKDGIVVGLGQSIYDEQAFDHLPILADALEDAGCTDTGLLGHLRSAGPHVRGC